MSLFIMATYPVEGGATLEGPVTPNTDGTVSVDGSPIPACQGTAALLAAACQTSAHLGTAPPYALIAGDIGRGDGTRAAFKLLAEAVARARPAVLVFHYMQPIMTLMRHALAELAEVCPDALLVADAGGMYAAKAAGLASHFELMTPDVGEIGFLADPKATHPAYVAHHLFGTSEFDPVQLSGIAYEEGGSSRVLLVKGERDYIVEAGTIVATVEEPSVPAL